MEGANSWALFRTMSFISSRAKAFKERFSHRQRSLSDSWMDQTSLDYTNIDDTAGQPTFEGGGSMLSLLDENAEWGPAIVVQRSRSLESVSTFHRPSIATLYSSTAPLQCTQSTVSIAVTPNSRRSSTIMQKVPLPKPKEQLSVPSCEYIPQFFSTPLLQSPAAGDTDSDLLMSPVPPGHPEGGSDNQFQEIKNTPRGFHQQSISPILSRSRPCVPKSVHSSSCIQISDSEIPKIPGPPSTPKKMRPLSAYSLDPGAFDTQPQSPSLLDLSNESLENKPLIDMSSPPQRRKSRPLSCTSFDPLTNFESQAQVQQTSSIPNLTNENYVYPPKIPKIRAPPSSPRKTRPLSTQSLNPFSKQSDLIEFQSTSIPNLNKRTDEMVKTDGSTSSPFLTSVERTPFQQQQQNEQVDQDDFKLIFAESNQNQKISSVPYRKKKSISSSSLALNLNSRKPPMPFDPEQWRKYVEATFPSIQETGECSIKNQKIKGSPVNCSVQKEEMDFKFELNLQRMTLVRIAVSLWENPAVKNDVRHFWNECDSEKKLCEAFEKYRCKWSKVTNKVLDQLKGRKLPAILECELSHVVIQIGTKILGWIHYLQKTLPCDNGGEVMDYAERIYWTHYGAIDEVKIIKFFWLDNPKLNIVKVSKIACNYMLEESTMKQLFKKAKENMEKCQFKDKNTKRYLFGYWMWHENYNLKSCSEELMKMIIRTSSPGYLVNETFDSNCSVNENMLKLSVRVGFFHAVQYFWDKLSEEEKDKNIVNVTLTSIKGFEEQFYGYDYKDLYKENQYVQICLFFMDHMSKTQLHELYHEEKFDVIKFLEMILFCWPWQEFFLSALQQTRETWGEQCDDFSLLEKITSIMSNEYDLGYSVKSSKYRIILHKVWLSIRLRLKRIQKVEYSTLVNDLFHVRDISSLKMIVHEPCMADQRCKLIINSLYGMGLYECPKLIKACKFEFLNEFIDEIFVSDEEKKTFKQKIDIFHYFIKDPCRNHRNDFCGCLNDIMKCPSETFPNPKPNYETLDKLLDWQSSSLEERKQLKTRIDDKRVCQFFTDHGLFDTADEFLNWRFESEEEISDLKNSFKSDPFSRYLIYKVWFIRARKAEAARKKSYMFLNWFLKSEKEIEEFKKEELLTDLSDDWLHDIFNKKASAEITVDFFDWCLSSDDEKIKHLKQRIIDSGALNKKCSDLISTGLSKEAEDFVKWTFDNEEHKKDFMRAFLLSESGLNSLDSFFKNQITFIRRCSRGGETFIQETAKENLTKFIDIWIKPLENPDEIRNVVSLRSSRLVGSGRYYEKLFHDVRQLFMDILLEFIKKKLKSI